MGLGSLKNPNFLILITDETRWPMHWPEGWVAENLPALQSLMNNGLTFTNAFTAACECSPSRASFVTSTYPNFNGVTGTPGNLPVPSATLATIGTVLETYAKVQWKGKWHLTPSPWGPNTLQKYELYDWNPPDAGTSIGVGSPSFPTLGGGMYNNDARFTGIVTSPPFLSSGSGTSALDFLDTVDPSSSTPFCLVVSLVNPHDVYIYGGGDHGIAPRTLVGSAGYDTSVAFDQGIGSPANAFDPLTTKPAVQLEWRSNYNAAVPLTSPAEIADYVNFYAYLHTQSDQLLGAVLAKLASKQLTDNTIIVRYADHGEMAFSHGMREKFCNAYEESIHIPLIFSNPVLWPEPVTTDALASTLDIVPTLAEIAGTTPGSPSPLRGQSLVPILDGSATTIHPQGVVYTYDDFGVFGSYPSPANAGYIRCLRTETMKYAVYFDTTKGNAHYQYELYDLTADPGELVNLLWGSPVDGAQWNELHATLTSLLNELDAMPLGLTNWPKNPGG